MYHSNHTEQKRIQRINSHKRDATAFQTDIHCTNQKTNTNFKLRSLNLCPLVVDSLLLLLRLLLPQRLQLLPLALLLCLPTRLLLLHYLLLVLHMYTYNHTSDSVSCKCSTNTSRRTENWGQLVSSGALRNRKEKKIFLSPVFFTQA